MRPEFRTRFAPSPTGPPHLGTLHTALFAFLAARKNEGRFVVRMDDTDPERSKPEWESEVLAALEYLGLDWDEGPDKGGPYAPYRQSERLDIYAKAIERLRKDDFLYPCFCTESDLNLQRTVARAAGRAYVYDGRCRNLAGKEAEQRIQGGASCVWRFHVDPARFGEAVEFRDLVFGEQVFQTSLIGDFVCVRGDGKPTYMLVSPVDDASMEITHVIRGADHIPNTPAQILLLRALGHDPPEFAHLPLITGPGGRKLSKRDSMTGLDEIRRYLPEALINHLALLGWTHPAGKEVLDPDELVSSFSFNRVSTSSATHDPARLAHLERKHLARMSPPKILEAWRKSAYSTDIELDEDRTDTVRRILALVRDEIGTFDAVGRDILPLVEAPTADVLREAFEKFDPHEALAPINALRRTCGGQRLEVVERLAAEQGKRQVYMPLRIALTGRKSGFELSKLMQAFTLDEIDRRLHRARMVLMEMAETAS